MEKHGRVGLVDLGLWSMEAGLTRSHPLQTIEGQVDLQFDLKKSLVKLIYKHGSSGKSP